MDITDMEEIEEIMDESENYVAKIPKEWPKDISIEDMCEQIIHICSNYPKQGIFIDIARTYKDMGEGYYLGMYKNGTGCLTDSENHIHIRYLSGITAQNQAVAYAEQLYSALNADIQCTNLSNFEKTKIRQGACFYVFV